METIQSMFDILEKDLKNEKSYMIVDLIVEMFVNSSSKKQACSLAETLVSVSQCLENMFLKYCKICFDKCFWLMNGINYHECPFFYPANSICNFRGHLQSFAVH